MVKYTIFQKGWVVIIKLIYAIVRTEDSSAVIEELTKNKFSITKLATTGGFLRRGNTTLLIGTEEEQVPIAIEIVKKECGKRKQIVYNMPYAGGMPIENCSAVPVPVDVGGATIFVVDVEHFEKI